MPALAPRAGLLVAALLGACVPSYEEKDDAGARPKDLGLIEEPDAASADGGPAADAEAADAPAPDADPPLPDGDGDGIPDPEDPAPSRPNTLLFRDDFTDTSQGWIFTSVSIGIRAAQSALSTDVLEPYVREGWVGPRAAWADYYVRTRLRVREVSPAVESGSGRAGVFLRATQVSPDRYYLCTLDAKQNALVLTEHNGGTPAGSTLASAPVNVPRNTWVRLNFKADRAGLACDALGASVSASSTTFSAGAVGFRSLDATFDADWVEVYEIF